MCPSDITFCELLLLCRLSAMWCAFTSVVVEGSIPRVVPIRRRPRRRHSLTHGATTSPHTPEAPESIGGFQVFSRWMCVNCPAWKHAGIFYAIFCRPEGRLFCTLTTREVVTCRMKRISFRSMNERRANRERSPRRAALHPVRPAAGDRPPPGECHAAGPD